MEGIRRDGWRPILALLALFSGVALLLNILAKLDLRLGLIAMTACLVFGVVWVLRGSSAAQRREVARETAVGALAGITATLAYDVAKAALAVMDPSAFNPFHAIGVFGQLLVGTTEPGPVTLLAGIAFHLLNGTTFGVAYVLLFARHGSISAQRAVITGLTWGLFLEMFQITLYPGWLDVRAYAEFAAISFLGHVVYGFTLGVVARAGLQKWSEPSAQRGGSLDG